MVISPTVKVRTPSCSPAQSRRSDGTSEVFQQPRSDTALAKSLAHFKVDCVRGCALVNVREWPLEWILAPDIYLPEWLAAVMLASENYIAGCLFDKFEKLKSTVSFPFSNERLKKLVIYQSHVRYHISAFSHLGSELADEYAKKTSKPFRWRAVCDLVDVKGFRATPYLWAGFYSEPDISSTPAFVIERARSSFTSYMPVRKEGVSCIADGAKHSVMRAALGSHAKGRLPIHKAPVFYNFIPPEIADRIAENSVFMDGLESLFLRHGKFSHCFQIGNMFHDDILQSQSDLEYIVKNQLWTRILDQRDDFLDIIQFPISLLKDMKGFPEAASFNQIVVNGLTITASSNAPAVINNLLVTGNLSSSLRRLSQYSDKGFKKAMVLLDISSSNPEESKRALEKKLESLMVLETYVADSYFKNIDKLLATLAELPSEKSLYDIRSTRDGNFINSRESDQACAEKLKRACQKKRVMTVHRRRCGRLYVREVTQACVPEHFVGFISFLPDDTEGPKQLFAFLPSAPPRHLPIKY